MFSLFPLAPSCCPDHSEQYWSYSSPYLPSVQQLNSKDELVITFNRLARAIFSSDKKYIEFKIKKSMEEDVVTSLQCAGYSIDEITVKNDNLIKLKIHWE